MKLNPKVEEFRVTTGKMASKPGKDYGLFSVFFPVSGRELTVIACAGRPKNTNDPSAGWDHVSVSLPNRCPNWPEMCFVKDLFFDEEETVFQFHPKKSAHVNNHPYCLHLWKPLAQEIPLPPEILIGVKKLGVML